MRELYEEKRKLSGESVPYVSLGLLARGQSGMVLPPLSLAKAERGSWDHSKALNKSGRRSALLPDSHQRNLGTKEMG